MVGFSAQSFECKTEGGRDGEMERGRDLEKRTVESEQRGVHAPDDEHPTRLVSPHLKEPLAFNHFLN